MIALFVAPGLGELLIHQILPRRFVDTLEVVGERLRTVEVVDVENHAPNRIVDHFARSPIEIVALAQDSVDTDQEPIEAAVVGTLFEVCPSEHVSGVLPETGALTMFEDVSIVCLGKLQVLCGERTFRPTKVCLDSEWTVGIFLDGRSPSRS